MTTNSLPAQDLTTIVDEASAIAARPLEYWELVVQETAPVLDGLGDNEFTSDVGLSKE